MGEVILKANNVEFKDEEARKNILKQETKIETINNRTKNHTIDIRDLYRRINELENKK